MRVVTWDPNFLGSDATLFNNNLTHSGKSATSSATRSTLSHSGGKWYWEITINSGGHQLIGIIDSSANSPNTNFAFSSSIRGITVTSKRPEGTPYGSGISIGDVIGIALDLDNGTLEFYKNGVSQGISHTDIKTMQYPIYAFVQNNNSTVSGSVTANFGATPFQYPIPRWYYSYDGTQYGGLNKILLLSDGQVKTYQEDGQWTNINKGLADISEQDYIDYGIDVGDLPNIDLSQSFTKKSFISKNSSLLGSGQVFQQTIDTNKYKIKKITIK